MNNGQGPSERAAIDRLRSEGCEVMVGGWPDLLVKNTQGRVFGLELKSEKDKLRYAQMDMHNALSRWVSLPTLTLRYSNLEGVSESCVFGVASPRDLHADVHQQAHDAGYAAGYEQAKADTIKHFFGKRRSSHFRAKQAQK